MPEIPTYSLLMDIHRQFSCSHRIDLTHNTSLQIIHNSRRIESTTKTVE